MMNKNDMKGLFFVMKGQYRKDNDPEGVCISGYDPYDTNTSEWYQVIDNVCFNTIACGNDLTKVVRSVYIFIKRFRTRKNYFRYLSRTTSDDYYETHYLGRRPLTDKERTDKARGRCPRTSPAMRKLVHKVYDHFGDYFSDIVQEMEDLAYAELKENTHLKRTKSILSKTPKVTPTPTPLTPKVTPSESVATPKVITPKKFRPVRKFNI